MGPRTTARAGAGGRRRGRRACPAQRRDSRAGQLRARVMRSVKVPPLAPLAGPAPVPTSAAACDRGPHGLTGFLECLRDLLQVREGALAGQLHVGHVPQRRQEVDAERRAPHHVQPQPLELVGDVEVVALVGAGADVLHQPRHRPGHDRRVEAQGAVVGDLGGSRGGRDGSRAQTGRQRRRSGEREWTEPAAVHPAERGLPSRSRGPASASTGRRHARTGWCAS